MKPKHIIYVVIAMLAVLAVLPTFFDKEGNPRSFGGNAITDTLITASYPDLYRALFAREEAMIVPFLDHPSDAVRRQAWRALAVTPVDSIGPYLDRAAGVNAEVPWFAVSMHELSAGQLRSLERKWRDDASLRGGLARVMGRQGDRRTLGFLLEKMKEHAGTSYEYAYALAVGRLMTRHELSGEYMHQKIFEQAFAASDPQITRAYLYGYYRGDSQKLSAARQNALYGAWKSYGLGRSAPVDQYIARLLKGKVFYEQVLYYNSEDQLDREIQLAVELAQVLGDLKLDERNILAARMLVMHDNPVVSGEALASLDGKLSEEEDDLLGYVTSEILPDTSRAEVVWLQALDTAVGVRPRLADTYAARMDSVRRSNPYLLPRVLDVWSRVEPAEAFVGRLAAIVDEGDPLSSMYAINKLRSYWDALSETEQQAMADRVHDIAFDALHMGDRGVAYSVAGLLGEERIAGEGDYRHIIDALSAFRLPGDIEVYQSMGGMLRERYPQKAKSFVDSLASLGYSALNRSLHDAGWEVEVPDAPAVTFRKPDWDRLWKFGEHPVWVLHTEKGNIKVEMNTLSAPATVSAIDSLTLAGAYDGVPFHRVVPNFVIQGGDIERSDGFGGPDFTIPTEPSERAFVRGAAGIASAGTDTEGSQYFFMHQWKPHLNGRYTLFGTVVEGMEVVDRITVGDKVLQAYWGRQ